MVIADSIDLSYNQSMLTDTLLNPTQDDLQRVFDFMIACDVAEFGAPDSDLGDLTDQWNDVDLAKDAWIALDEQGVLIGYALFSRTSNIRCDLDTYVNANTSPRELWQVFYDRALKRFREVSSSGACETGCVLVTYVNGRNAHACQNAESHGFAIKKYHYRMQMDFTEPYPAPDWPQEYKLLPYSADAEGELYDLIVEAFDWEGVVPFDRDTWKKQVFRNGRIDPEDFILVRCGGRLVAAALCYNEGDLIWLKELAVSKTMQGKGLGSLLLKYLFHHYSSKGVPTLALGVVSTNPKAAGFYEHAGMQRTREFVQYEYGV